MLIFNSDGVTHIRELPAFDPFIPDSPMLSHEHLSIMRRMKLPTKGSVCTSYVRHQTEVSPSNRFTAVLTHHYSTTLQFHAFFEKLLRGTFL